MFFARSCVPSALFCCYSNYLHIDRKTFISLRCNKPRRRYQSDLSACFFSCIYRSTHTTESRTRGASPAPTSARSGHPAPSPDWEKAQGEGAFAENGRGQARTPALREPQCAGVRLRERVFGSACGFGMTSSRRKRHRFTPSFPRRWESRRT